MEDPVCRRLSQLLQYFEMVEIPREQLVSLMRFERSPLVWVELKVHGVAHRKITIRVMFLRFLLHLIASAINVKLEYVNGNFPVTQKKVCHWYERVAWEIWNVDRDHVSIKCLERSCFDCRMWRCVIPPFGQQRPLQPRSRFVSGHAAQVSLQTSVNDFYMTISLRMKVR